MKGFREEREGREFSYCLLLLKRMTLGSAKSCFEKKEAQS